MPIRFPCPHCKRGLSVKDHLAGKRAACPACKQPLTIPAASAAPAAEDVEALAAAALGEAKSLGRNRFVICSLRQPSDAA
jgi:uncharacterized protein YbaR (Trm112 family)